jgi:hypothetical protein
VVENGCIKYMHEKERRLKGWGRKMMRRRRKRKKEGKERERGRENTGFTCMTIGSH